MITESDQFVFLFTVIAQSMDVLIEIMECAQKTDIPEVLKNDEAFALKDSLTLTFMETDFIGDGWPICITRPVDPKSALPVCDHRYYQSINLGSPLNKDSKTQLDRHRKSSFISTDRSGQAGRDSRSIRIDCKQPHQQEGYSLINPERKTFASQKDHTDIRSVRAGKHRRFVYHFFV